MPARKRNDKQEGRAVYVISVAAELAGVHPQTLRMYERKGLLRPERTTGSVRRYSDEDVERVRLIQSLTQERGVNLAGVEMVVALTRQLDEARDRMERLERQIDEAHRRMQEEIDRVRRSYRADLVPLRIAMVPYRQQRESKER
jgi:MerR family transcriptional regulator/heat shock protein HspR